jgi:mRNA interferase MazF
VKPWEIWLARVPFTDLSSDKVRPVLIVANAQENGLDFVVVAISSVVRNNQPYDIVVRNADADFVGTGLKVDSAIKANKIVTISRSIFQKRLGILSEAGQSKVKDQLRALFKL